MSSANRLLGAGGTMARCELYMVAGLARGPFVVEIRCRTRIGVRLDESD